MIADPEPDLVVLDALNIALRYDYLDAADVVAALQARSADEHVCVTGRQAPSELQAAVDLVTAFTAVRHPFEAGFKPQRGIDFESSFRAGIRRPYVLRDASKLAPQHDEQGGIPHPSSSGQPLKRASRRTQTLSKRAANRRRWRPVALAAGLAAVANVASAAAPRKIVSLNPCLDAILLDVADPSQIRALSHYSMDPSQFAMAAQARPYRHISSSAEEVAALRPDLVLVSGIGSRQLVDVLLRLHISSASFTVPRTIAESLAQVRRMAALTGHPERGEALAARIQAALKQAEPAPGEPPLSALVFEGRGLASGPHTLMSELMTRTGFRNKASAYSLTRTVDLPLERVLVDPPQVLLSGQLEPGEPSWADRVLSHPALAALGPRMRKEDFPQALLFCAGPVLIPAAAALAHARRDADGWPR